MNIYGEGGNREFEGEFLPQHPEGELSKLDSTEAPEDKEVGKEGIVEEIKKTYNAATTLAREAVGIEKKKIQPEEGEGVPKEPKITKPKGELKPENPEVA